jgi:succinoglycan biosynthesis transport protein ExoP
VSATLLEDAAMPGLGEYLLEKASFSEITHASKTPNLTVIPAGQSAPKPGEMLASPRFACLISEARANFELIVIDSAPIHPVSDSLLILEHTDAVCLVVRLGRVSTKAVLRACQVLAQFGRRPAGLIMNAVPNRSTPLYYCAAGSYGHRGYRAALTG